MYTNQTEDEIDDDEIIRDGDSVSVPMFLRDGETLPQLRARIARVQTQTLDAYQQFLADRDAWRQKQAAELQAISDGTPSRSFAAVLDARDAAWQKRGEQQSAAWQRRPASEAGSSTTHLQHDASLKDVTTARDAAWQKRGEILSNAWKR